MLVAKSSLMEPAQMMLFSSNRPAGILISINYTANLISYLTVSRQEAPITSLEEFASRPDWTLAMEHGVGILADWAVRREFICPI